MLVGAETPQPMHRHIGWLGSSSSTMSTHAQTGSERLAASERLRAPCSKGWLSPVARVGNTPKMPGASLPRGRAGTCSSCSSSSWSWSCRASALCPWPRAPSRSAAHWRRGAAGSCRGASARLAVSSSSSLRAPRAREARSGLGLNMGIERRGRRGGSGSAQPEKREERRSVQRRASGAGGGPPTGINVFWTVFGCVSMKAKNSLFLLCLETFWLCFPPRDGGAGRRASVTP